MGSKKLTELEDDDLELAKVVQIVSVALSAWKRKPADPPVIYKHLDCQDIKVWLLTCEDDFARNPTNWVKEDIIMILLDE